MISFLRPAGFSNLATLFIAVAFAALTRAADVPRALPRLDDLGRERRSHYGSLESAMQQLRAYQPMDLHAPRWRQDNPRGTHEQWAREARALLGNGLHTTPAPLALNAVTLERWETDAFVRETIE